jgi:hypothetical protein
LDHGKRVFVASEADHQTDDERNMNLNNIHLLALSRRKPQFRVKKPSLYLAMAYLLALGSCFEPKEGCIDIAATNLDVSADKACDDCCEYPILKMTIRQGYDTLPFIENNIYENDLGQLFRIKSIVFYCSDFSLTQGITAKTPKDSTILKRFLATGDTITERIPDDVVLIRRASNEVPIGSFLSDGNFEAIEFRLGLNDTYQQVISPLAPAGHPLQKQTDSLWYGRDKGYVFMQVIVARDTSAGAPIDTFSLTKLDLPNTFIKSNPSNVFTKMPGFDFTIQVRADYKPLFAGIDWSLIDKSLWKSMIVANLPDVFYIVK